MKRFAGIILILVASSLGAEVCNNGGTGVQVPLGSCYSDGYVCELSIEYTGIIRVALGIASNCQTLATTSFTTYPTNENGSLDYTQPIDMLKPILVQDAGENVGALAVAVSSAFLINALNEKYKVRLVYHRVGNLEDINSVRLQSVNKLK